MDLFVQFGSAWRAEATPPSLTPPHLRTGVPFGQHTRQPRQLPAAAPLHPAQVLGRRVLRYGGPGKGHAHKHEMCYQAHGRRGVFHHTEDAKRLLRELKLLKHLGSHTNIVRMADTFHG